VFLSILSVQFLACTFIASPVHISLINHTIYRFFTMTFVFVSLAGGRHCAAAIWTGMLPHLQAFGAKWPIRTEASMDNILIS
jgi:hypothetical protein